MINKKYFTWNIIVNKPQQCVQKIVADYCRMVKTVQTAQSVCKHYNVSTLQQKRLVGIRIKHDDHIQNV